MGARRHHARPRTAREPDAERRSGSITARVAGSGPGRRILSVPRLRCAFVTNGALECKGWMLYLSERSRTRRGVEPIRLEPGRAAAYSRGRRLEISCALTELLRHGVYAGPDAAEDEASRQMLEACGFDSALEVFAHAGEGRVISAATVTGHTSLGSPNGSRSPSPIDPRPPSSAQADSAGVEL
jgi:hypothetical protein